jgi:hypothetical protein
MEKAGQPLEILHLAEILERSYRLAEEAPA